MTPQSSNALTMEYKGQGQLGVLSIILVLQHTSYFRNRFY